MKFAVALVVIASICSGIEAFAPLSSTTSLTGRVKTARFFGIDPSTLADVHQHVDAFQNVFSSMTLADAADATTAAVTAATDMVDTTAAAVTSAAADINDAAVSTASDAVDTAATDNGGFFGFLTMPIEFLLTVMHSILSFFGVSSNSWGISILMMTIIIKVLTFPLTKTQMESTQKMQAMQPTLKAIQDKFQSNPEVMNQKIAALYQENNVNPLAGCIPSLLQIPIFIGLYRAVLNLAKEDKINEPFLFLPSLEGPTYGADPTHGTDWIMQNWVDGTPSLGWDNTIAFLVLPVVLVISQYLSMELMQPPAGPDGKKVEQPAFLKFLPLMIGWFSLSVPSALCIYWFANNIFTTATSIYLRNSMNLAPAGGGAAASAPQKINPEDMFAPPPMRDVPAGFASSSFDTGDVKPLTAIDVEVEDDDDGEDTSSDSPPSSSSGTKKKRGKRKKKKN